MRLFVPPCARGSLVLLLALAASGCASLSVPGGEGRLDGRSGREIVAYSFVPAGTAPAENRAVQERLVDGALAILGKDRLVVGGRHFSYDCTGTILAIYYSAGIDLARYFPRYSGNGVKRLYGIMRDRGLLVSTDYPRPGDLVFWNNTYDANGNGLADDGLTHVGMVIDADRAGNIRYVHLNYRTGIVIERMNLLHPGEDVRDGWSGRVVVNSPLRRRGERAGAGTTSGELFGAFAAGYLLPAGN